MTIIAFITTPAVTEKILTYLGGIDVLTEKYLSKEDHVCEVDNKVAVHVRAVGPDIQRRFYTHIVARYRNKVIARGQLS